MPAVSSRERFTLGESARLRPPGRFSEIVTEEVRVSGIWELSEEGSEKVEEEETEMDGRNFRQ